MNGGKLCLEFFDDLFFAYVFMSNCHFPCSSKKKGEFGEWVALKLLKKKVFDVFVSKLEKQEGSKNGD